MLATFRLAPVASPLPPLQYRDRRLPAKRAHHRITTLVVFRWAMAVYLLAYGYLGFRLIHFQQSAFRFNPNVRVGTTSFKILDYQSSDNRLGGPSCTHYQQDYLLIKASTTRFKDLISYSRRLASPNDHELIAVFVRDSVSGQQWKYLAEHGPVPSNKRRVYPRNWTAELFIRQGGMDNDSVTSQLIDLAAYRADGGGRMWQTKTSFHTDSLIERMVYWHRDDPFPWQVIRFRARPLLPTDAAYHSPYRLRLHRRTAF
jgi:hypothetical protein